MKTERYYIGDSCLCWSFGNKISKDTSASVLNLFRFLSDEGLKKELGIVDLVPSYKALAIHFDLIAISPSSLIEKVETIIEQVFARDNDATVAPESSKIIHKIPVVYDGDDLARVAEINGLEIPEVIDLHRKPEYVVAMIGFQPYFPYLIGLDDRLETPRLDSPRTKVPEGSVAIGGAQTGIYPSESPGGWNIVGTTKSGLLRNINPGDLILFEKVEKL